MFTELFWCIIYTQIFISCQGIAIPSATSQLIDPLPNIPCNFENGLCPAYEIDHTADFEWMLMSGPTSSILTGPDGDNTPNGNGKGYYVYIESSKRLNGDEARLLTKSLDHTKTNGQKLCLEFFYHMNGHTMGEFSVGIVTVNNSVETNKFLIKGNQHHTKWQKGRFSFDTPNQPYKIIFRGKTSFGFYGDIGLDDINLKLARNGACDFWPTNATTSSRMLRSHNALLQPTLPIFNSKKSPENPNTCGRSKIAMGRIFGGTPVTPVGKWPWMVMLQVISNNKFDHRCGGTLLSNKWIITAAHCVYDLPFTSYIRVRLGTHERNAQEPNTQDIGVKNIFIHPEYNTKTAFNKDIALLELKRPAIINNYVESICLMKDERVEHSPTCVLTGWGKLWGPSHDTKSDFANLLNEASVRIKEENECKDNFRAGQVTEHMLCAKGVNNVADACEGDSGGPLMCQDQNGRWSLVGITSWGHPEGCSVREKFSVYTRMSKFNDWVIHVTSNPHLAKPLH